MSEFTEIKIKVKLTDNGNAVINNEDGICTEIEELNDFYEILPLIKRKVANGIKTSESGLNLDNVVGRSEQLTQKGKCMNCTKDFDINHAGCFCPECFLD